MTTTFMVYRPLILNGISSLYRRASQGAKMMLTSWLAPGASTLGGQSTIMLSLFSYLHKAQIVTTDYEQGGFSLQTSALTEQRHVLLPALHLRHLLCFATSFSVANNHSDAVITLMQGHGHRKDGRLKRLTPCQS